MNTRFHPQPGPNGLPPARTRTRRGPAGLAPLLLVAACSSTPTLHQSDADTTCRARPRPVARYSGVVELRILADRQGRAHSAAWTAGPHDPEVTHWLLCDALARPWHTPSAESGRHAVIRLPLLLVAGQPAPTLDACRTLVKRCDPAADDHACRRPATPVPPALACAPEPPHR